MKEFLKMANLTMHDQSAYVRDFAELGFEIEAAPRLKTVSSPLESIEQAFKIGEALSKEKIKYALLGGKTDLAVYLAVEMASRNIQTYTVNTERVRDENDRFIFQFKGLDKLCIRMDNRSKGTVCITPLVDDEMTFTAKVKEETGNKFSDAAISRLYEYYNEYPRYHHFEYSDLSEWAELNAKEIRELTGYKDIGLIVDIERDDYSEVLLVKQEDRRVPNPDNPWSGYETDTYLVELEPDEAAKYKGNVFER